MAFIKLDNDRGIILKKGSRTGYLKGSKNMVMLRRLEELTSHSHTTLDAPVYEVDQSGQEDSS